MSSYDQFVLFLFRSGFRIYYDKEHVLTRRIVIKVDNLEINIDDFSFEEMIVHFNWEYDNISHLDFIFDMNNHFEFITKLDNAFLSIRSAYNAEFYINDVCDLDLKYD